MFLNLLNIFFYFPVFSSSPVLADTWRLMPKPTIQSVTHKTEHNLNNFILALLFTNPVLVCSHSLLWLEPAMIVLGCCNLIYLLAHCKLAIPVSWTTTATITEVIPSRYNVIIFCFYLTKRYHFGLLVSSSKQIIIF